MIYDKIFIPFCIFGVFHGDNGKRGRVFMQLSHRKIEFISGFFCADIEIFPIL